MAIPITCKSWLSFRGSTAKGHRLALVVCIRTTEPLLATQAQSANEHERDAGKERIYVQDHISLDEVLRDGFDLLCGNCCLGGHTQADYRPVQSGSKRLLELVAARPGWNDSAGELHRADRERNQCRRSVGGSK